MEFIIIIFIIVIILLLTSIIKYVTYICMHKKSNKLSFWINRTKIPIELEFPGTKVSCSAFQNGLLCKEEIRKMRNYIIKSVLIHLVGMSIKKLKCYDAIFDQMNQSRNNISEPTILGTVDWDGMLMQEHQNYQVYLT